MTVGGSPVTPKIALDTKIFCLEILTLFSALTVVAGLVGEHIFESNKISITPSTNPEIIELRTPQSVASEDAVVAGVAGELLFGILLLLATQKRISIDNVEIAVLAKDAEEMRK
jgi:hypothetical protein